MTTTAKPITVLIADDHPVVLEGLSSFISTDRACRVVAKALNGTQAVELFSEHRPDVSIIDLKMPRMDGLEVIRQIRKIDPQAKIIVLSSFDGGEVVYQALQAGAMSYVVKEALYEELIATIKIVHEGKKQLNSDVAAKLIDRLTSSPLSAREIEVLELIVRGKSNAEIAEALTITEGTVKIHVHNILKKLNASDRAAAVTTALTSGIVRI